MIRLSTQPEAAIFNPDKVPFWFHSRLSGLLGLVDERKAIVQTSTLSGRVRTWGMRDVVTGFADVAEGASWSETETKVALVRGLCTP